MRQKFIAVWVFLSPGCPLLTYYSRSCSSLGFGGRADDVHACYLLQREVQYFTAWQLQEEVWAKMVQPWWLCRPLFRAFLPCQQPFPPLPCTPSLLASHPPPYCTIHREIGHLLRPGLLLQGAGAMFLQGPWLLHSACPLQAGTGGPPASWAASHASLQALSLIALSEQVPHPLRSHQI